MPPLSRTRRRPLRQSASPPQINLGVYVCSACFLLLALQPLVDSELWWHLSRGREVLNGSLSPSQTLLAADHARESDWLGGVPVFLFHQTLGISGLMLLKLGWGVALGWVFWHSAPGLPNALRLLLAIVALWSVQSAWDPTPAALDVLGVLLVFVLSRKWCEQPTWGRLWGLVAIMGLWANLAPLFVAGMLVLLVNLIRPGMQSRSWRHSRTAVVGLTLIAASITPRGVWGWWDSLRLLAPRLAVSGEFLERTPWRTLWAASWSPAEIAFGMMTALGLLLLVRRTLPWSSVFGITISQVIAWSCHAHLAAAACWTSLIVLGEVRWPDSWSYAWTRLRTHRWIGRLLFGAALLLLLSPLTGGANSRQRLGWGLDPHLDAQPLQQALNGLELPGTAHCTGARAAGLLAWLNQHDLRPYDHPRRALLAGRLPEHLLLNADLAAGRRFRYRRSDGSWGGYWLALQRRRSILLLVPAERFDVLQGLLQSDFLTSMGKSETGIWRPAAVGSLMVPLVRADGSPECRRRILKVEQAFQTLAWGAWPMMSPSAGGSATHTDLWGLVSRQVDASAWVEEARMLRAMERPLSAVRFLAPAMRLQPSSTVMREFLSCQLELAYEERRRTGKASRFRTEVVHRLLLATSVSPDQILTALQQTDFRTKKTAPNLVGSLNAYLSGDTRRAASLLSEVASNGTALVSDRSSLSPRNDMDPEILYALGWLLVESGEPQQAADVFRRIRSAFPKHRLSRMAQYVLQFLP